MTRQEVIAELRQVRTELIREVDRLQSLADAIDVDNEGAKLLVYYVVPHLQQLVRDDEEFSDLVPNLGDAIASVAR